jgi:hypothetical protein
MPIPQVTDRIKEAPAVVLRAVFAGIGQLLMAADKLRAQMQEQATSAPAAQKRPSDAQPARSADEASNVTPLHERAAPAAARPAAARTGAAETRPTAATTTPVATKTTAAEAAAPKPAAPKPGATKPAAPKTTAPKTTAPKAAAPKAAATKAASGSRRSAPEPSAAQAAAPAPSAAQAAPIPGYDDLSIASLRARLRGLDAADVQALLAYEKANAHRDDVVTMFERRIAKLQNGTS